jgi:hypothetical protein
VFLDRQSEKRIEESESEMRQKERAQKIREVKELKI